MAGSKIKMKASSSAKENKRHKPNSLGPASIDFSGCDQNEAAVKNKRKPGFTSFFLIIMAIACVAFFSYLLFQPEAEAYEPTTTDLAEIGCEENTNMIADGVCDEATNTEQCSFDGGDCCLPHKSTPLCNDCTCRMIIDQDSLQDELDQFDVQMFDSVSDFNEVVIDNSLVEVEDVESLLVCARLCLDTIKSGNIVNGWMFDSAIQLCACSYLDPTLCLAEKSLNPLTTDKEIHSDIALGFVMLSMTLQCGNVHKNIVSNQFQPQTFYRFALDTGPAIFDNPNMIDSIRQPSPWHCKQACLAFPTCDNFLWLIHDISDLNCYLFTNGNELLNRDCQGAIYGTTNGNLSVNVEEEIQLTLKLFEHEKLGVTTCLDEYDPYDAKSTCSVESYNRNAILVVTSGMPAITSTPPRELVHLDPDPDPAFDTCSSLPEHPFPTLQNSKVGGILDGNVPVICGGTYFIHDTNGWHISNECYKMDQNPNPKPIGQMQGDRSSAASILLRDRTCGETVLWVTGGWNWQYHVITSDLVTLTQITPGPNLPTDKSGHCMLKMGFDSDNRIGIVGGNNNYGTQTELVIFDWTDHTWTSGPELSIPRKHLTCGGILDSGDNVTYILVVAGGIETSKETEILVTNHNLDSGLTWTSGPDLPTIQYAAFGVTTWDRKRFFSMGGSTGIPSAIYEFTCYHLNCQWTNNPDRKLQNSMFAAVAMLLPDSLTELYCK